MQRRRSAILMLAAIGLVAASLDAAAQERFTLEQVMSSPFPSDLVVAPAGAKVAWVFNARGVRNIWVAEGPDYVARQVTAYDEDDGQAISNLGWTPDGTRLVYVRGGGPNRQGELPNPWSLPSGVKREIWIVDVAGGEPGLLAEGASPAIAPAGDLVAYLKGGAVWTIAPVGGEPERRVDARGGIGSLRWSPDATKLAFVSSRGDHSYIGVYDAQENTIGWLDPGVDRDFNPAWSEDGRRIAFIRIPTVSGNLPFGPRRAGQPWSIRVADVASGSGREIWKAEEGAGSVFHSAVAQNQLLWGAGDRIVFPWEGDGWLHLYSIPSRGGAAELLTPGAFEVEDVTLSADRRRVIFSSNQDDVDRRHIWSAPVDGGRAAALTRGAGIEWSPRQTADGDALAFLRSDARRPAGVAIQEAGSDAPRDLATEALPADFPAAALIEPRAVVFSASDGMQIHGQLFVPSDARPGDGRPAVMFFHGGSRRQMLLGWHYRGYYHNAYALNQYLASRGYVVLSVNYRSGTGYGMEFREAINYGATGASEFNDVLGGGLFLQQMAEVDPMRIGLWGGSYGGYLTALGLARASDLFAAGVDVHGVHDWNETINGFVPRYNPLEHPEFARTAFESSPMADVDTWRSPVLLIHGDDDRNVPFSETVTLVEQLRQRDIEFELLVFPDEVHGFTTYAHWLQAYRAAADFFGKHLQER